MRLQILTQIQAFSNIEDLDYLSNSQTLFDALFSKKTT